MTQAYKESQSISVDGFLRLLINTNHEAYGDDFTGRLYHFTSVYAFKNIIQEQRFLFSNWKEVNDATEVRYFMDHYSRERRIDKESTSIDGFLMCYSTERDHFHQWMVYGNRGQGISIEVDAANMMSDIKDSNPDLTLYARKVHYGLDYEKIEYYESLKVPQTNYLRTFFKSPTDDPEKLWSNWLQFQLNQMSWITKHPGFQDEREVRIIAFEKFNSKALGDHLLTSGSIRKCLSVRFQHASKWIKSIQLGPMVSESTAQWIKALVRTDIHDGIEITKSDLEIR